MIFIQLKLAIRLKRLQFVVREKDAGNIDAFFKEMRFTIQSEYFLELDL